MDEASKKELIETITRQNAELIRYKTRLKGKLKLDHSYKC